ncbi:MAG: hypothetical protein WBH86_12830 [Thermogutta sp.]|mgnify:CR=1 FL=1|nr:hypothetical protein [Thermogutta sp.]HPU05719.1 hypothetical protein [Thermogutta sp.]HQF13603.1 hypothetical protein [Thermogutta sp.]
MIVGEDLPVRDPTYGIAEVHRCLAWLLSEIPQLKAALGELAEPPGWEAMRKRFQSLEFCRNKGLSPPLVAVLFGPSGGGKSTWFRLLTGVNVPAGEEQRPTTCACVVAVPKKLWEREFLEGVFPSCELAELQDPNQLRVSSDRVFFCPQEDPQGLPFILADVPDFNTVESQNWERAERMLARAELVLFLTYSESYSDRRTVEMLARCCRLAGQLVYVFTKTEPEAAREKRRHLLQLVRERHDLGFDQKRVDGKTLSEFLAESLFYASPRVLSSEELSGERVIPLDETAPGFLSLLVGRDSHHLVVRGLIEAIREGIFYSKRLAEKAEKERNELEGNLRTIEELIHRAALTVVEGMFPVGRLVQLAVEECEKRVPALIRKSLGWMNGVTNRIRGKVMTVRDFFSLGGGSNREEETVDICDQSQLERKRLRQAVEHLVHEIRSHFPEEATANGIFSAERCEKARDVIESQPLPLAGIGWEASVREELAHWVRENKWTATTVSVIPTTLGISALGFLVADLGISGGLIGTLGTLSGLATVNGVAAWLLQYFGRWKLQQVAESAYQVWAEYRAKELAQFLGEILEAELFKPWKERLSRLAKHDLGKTLRACETLQQVLVNVRDAREEDATVFSSLGPAKETE